MNQKETDILEEILEALKQNYRRVMEIEKITFELSDILSAGDRESANRLLRMRGQELERADANKKLIASLLENLEGDALEKARALLNVEGGRPPEGRLEEEIAEFSRKTADVFAKIMQADAAASRKLAGKESFYKTKG